MTKNIYHAEYENRWFLIFCSRVPNFYMFSKKMIIIECNNCCIRTLDKCNKWSQSDIYVLKKLKTLLKWKHLTFLEKVEKAKKIMTQKIGMMTSSKQPPAGHNKYYFLKVEYKRPLPWKVSSLYHFPAEYG